MEKEISIYRTQDGVLEILLNKSKKLGKGSFRNVYEGTWIKNKIPEKVAIKAFNSDKMEKG